MSLRWIIVAEVLSLCGLSLWVWFALTRLDPWSTNAIVSWLLFTAASLYVGWVLGDRIHDYRHRRK